jgi:hypothetical protein
MILLPLVALPLVIWLHWRNEAAGWNQLAWFLFAVLIIAAYH